MNFLVPHNRSYRFYAMTICDPLIEDPTILHFYQLLFMTSSLSGGKTMVCLNFRHLHNFLPQHKLAHTSRVCFLHWNAKKYCYSPLSKESVGHLVISNLVFFSVYWRLKKPGDCRTHLNQCNLMGILQNQNFAN